MKKSIKNIRVQNLLSSMLKDSIKITLTAGAFYRYIAGQIRNGFIRSKFTRFSEEESIKHRNRLSHRLEQAKDKSHVSEANKPDIYSDVSSYSLIGAIHVAKESVIGMIRMCKGVKKQDMGHRKIYDEIIKDEKKYYKALKKEEDFPRPE